MQKMKYLPLALLLSVLSSCSSVRYMSVETYNPADVTFPQAVRRILIVDNALVPSQVPFKADISQKTDTVMIASGDVATVFCRALGEMMVESPCFEDVLLYDGRFRTDSLQWRDAMLTPAEVSRLCDGQDVDAVVSLDRLLFGMNESIQSVDDDGSAGLFLDVTVSGTLRTYLPGRRAPLDVAYLSDTIYSCIVPGLFDPFTPEDIRHALTAAFEGLAEKYHTRFVPHWSEDVRWYYVSHAARSKEAAAYMAAGRWTHAAAVWSPLYDAAASQEKKARIASNLALCCEMSGDFPKALEWAELACRHLTGNPDANERMLKLQQGYLAVLAYRIMAEKKLKEQVN
ncbi:MAG: DUF6340 family protein [Tannerella sp.]|jgi:hypothetical protein|nr:DUF6340 family protein [Tannerella sp.]